MAIYKEFTASNGVRCAFDDAYFRQKSPEELQRDYAALCRAAREIQLRAAIRAQREESERSETTQ